MVLVALVNNEMNAGGANRSSKVVAGKKIAGQGQTEQDNIRARNHHHAGCPTGLRCMEAGWAPALPAHFRASRMGRMAGVRFEEDDPVDLRAIPDRSPNREATQEACDAATLQPRPRSYLHS